MWSDHFVISSVPRRMHEQKFAPVFNGIMNVLYLIHHFTFIVLTSWRVFFLPSWNLWNKSPQLSGIEKLKDSPYSLEILSHLHPKQPTYLDNVRCRLFSQGTILSAPILSTEYKSNFSSVTPCNWSALFLESRKEIFSAPISRP